MVVTTAAGRLDTPRWRFAMQRIKLATVRLAPVVALIVAAGAGTKWH
jgi:hypothetical protein